MKISLIIVILFSLFISFKFSKKIAGKNQNNVLFTLFAFLVIACLNILTFALSESIFEENRDIFFYKKRYEGVVVGEKTGSTKVFNSTTDHIVYAPIVEFKDEKGKLVKIATNSYKPEEPKYASKRIVAYSENSSFAIDMSFMSNLIVFFGTILTGILIVSSYLITSYVFDVQKEKRIKISKLIFILFVIFDLTVSIGKLFF